ncbi:recombinase RecU [Bacillus cereus]|uniref:recombinase RecU n=1 Tax=Bacillus cereus TaxID=1396 RepID=UPI0018CF1140|nr:recombinase RecU [Bacillus cereus]MBG9714227.1 recombinase RecU [Bacillus cereus]
MGQGNRGMAFEMLINLANEMYQRVGVDYLQYIDEAVAPVRFDGMIQIDQNHKRVSNNIEAAKEKMANKKRKLLRA